MVKMAERQTRHARGANRSAIITTKMGGLSPADTFCERTDRFYSGVAEAGESVLGQRRRRQEE